MTSPITASVPLQIGDVIKDRYTLLKQIGAGTYGAIYAALYRGNMVTRLVAIKFEKVTQKYSLQYNEVALMKLLAGSSHFAKFYRCGTHEGFKFVCMELLGPSLIQLVNRKRPYQLNLFQLLKFGVQAIKCLQELHKAGFVHRDENFVIGNTKKTAGTIYLIDFGLCKRLPVVDGKIVKPTNKGSFRGTLRYASPNGHKLLELGRHDDLISLLYMMVEYYTGKLPWSNTEDINEILHLKQQSIGGRLFSKMPLQFQEFENHIFQLDFVDEPDYKKLIGLMFLVAYNSKLDLNNWPFEWEEELNQQREIVRHRLNSGLNESLFQSRNETRKEDNNIGKVNMNKKMNVINDQQTQKLNHIVGNINFEDKINYELTNINLLKEIQMFNMMIIKQQQQQQHTLKHKQIQFQRLIVQHYQQKFRRRSSQKSQQQSNQDYKQQISSKDDRLSQRQQEIQQLKNSINMPILQVAQQNKISISGEQKLVFQKLNHEKKIDQDSIASHDEKQSEESLFQLIQQPQIQNIDEQLKPQIPHIEVHTPVFIIQSSNKSPLNTNLSSFNQTQEQIQDSIIQDVQLETEYQQNINKQVFPNAIYPLKRSVSDIQLSPKLLEQHQQQLIQQKLNNNEIQFDQLPMNLNIVNNKDNQILIHSTSTSYDQIEIRNQLNNPIDDEISNQKINSHNETESTNTTNQYKQIPTEEEQHMMKPAFLEKEYSINSPQTNFSDFKESEQISQSSHQSSNQSFNQFLNTFHSLKDKHQYISLQDQHQYSSLKIRHQYSSSNINRHYRTVVNHGLDKLNINNNSPISKETKVQEESSETTIKKENDQINNKIHYQSNVNIKRSQSNVDVQQMKQNDQIKSPIQYTPKKYPIFDSNVQPKPIEVKIHDNISKQQSPQIRTSSPQGSLQSNQSIVVNSPFSTNLSQQSIVTPLSVSPQSISPCRSPSPKQIDANVAFPYKTEEYQIFNQIKDNEQIKEKKIEDQIIENNQNTLRSNAEFKVDQYNYKLDKQDLVDQIIEKQQIENQLNKNEVYQINIQQKNQEIIIQKDQTQLNNDINGSSFYSQVYQSSSSQCSSSSSSESTQDLDNKHQQINEKLFTYINNRNPISFLINQKSTESLEQISQIMVSKTDQTEQVQDQQQISSSPQLSDNNAIQQSEQENPDNNQSLQQTPISMLNNYLQLDQSEMNSNSSTDSISIFLDLMKMQVGNDHQVHQIVSRQIPQTQLSEIPEAQSTQLMQMSEDQNSDNEKEKENERYLNQNQVQNIWKEEDNADEENKISKIDKNEF